MSEKTKQQDKADKRAAALRANLKKRKALAKANAKPKADADEKQQQD